MAKYMRNNEKTPSGGAYSEIFFLDDKNNNVDAKEATHCVIRECSEDGTLLKETWGIVEQKSDVDKRIQGY